MMSLKEEQLAKIESHQEERHKYQVEIEKLNQRLLTSRSELEEQKARISSEA